MYIYIYICICVYVCMYACINAGVGLHALASSPSDFLGPVIAACTGHDFVSGLVRLRPGA